MICSNNNSARTVHVQCPHSGRTMPVTVPDWKSSGICVPSCVWVCACVRLSVCACHSARLEIIGDLFEFITVPVQCPYSAHTVPVQCPSQCPIENTWGFPRIHVSAIKDSQDCLKSFLLRKHEFEEIPKYFPSGTVTGTVRALYGHRTGTVRAL